MQHPGCGQETAWPPPSGLVQEDLPPRRAEVSHSHAAKEKDLVAFCSPLFRTFYNSYLKTFPTWHKVLCFPHQQRALVPFSFPTSVLFLPTPVFIPQVWPPSRVTSHVWNTQTTDRHKDSGQGRKNAGAAGCSTGASPARCEHTEEGAAARRSDAGEAGGADDGRPGDTRGRGRTSQAEKGVLGEVVRETFQIEGTIGEKRLKLKDMSVETAEWLFHTGRGPEVSLEGLQRIRL